MGGIKYILYFGSDDNLFKDIQSCCEKQINSKFQVVGKLYETNGIISSVTTKCPNIIYIDFTEIKEKEQVLEQILFIKNYQKFKSILFVAILGDTSSIEEQQLLYSSGFHLSYIKGRVIESIVLWSLYMGVNEAIPFPQYAKAKNINQEMSVGICSTISRMSLEEFVVETDLETTSENISLKLHMFKELETSSFKIKARNGANLLHPMTDTYKIEYPYVGPFDDITNETIQKETVETWLELNNEIFFEKDFFVKIVSKNTELSQPLFELAMNATYFIEFQEYLEVEKTKADLLLKKEPIIFIDIEESESDKNGIDSVSGLVSDIKSIENYNPIIIIANNPSKSEALQKNFRYQNIISVHSKLSIDIFKSFTQNFIEKGKSQSVHRNLYFRLSKSQKLIDIFINITVTSITEKELTFISKDELPMYSVLHLTLPIDCFVTIIPSPHQLDTTRLGKHYFGIIFGSTEEEVNDLRKFVNQIIHTPITEFSSEKVKEILQHKHKEVRINDENPDEEVKELRKIDIEPERFKRSTGKGKSKL
jgi:hypothetical protein